MEMKKAKINGKLTTVTSLDAYRENPDSYFLGLTAIEFDDLGVVLPVKGKYEKGVGITVGTLFSRITMPSEEERPQYSVDNIIDLSNVNNIKELMEKQELVRDIEYEMLTTIESKFSPTISDDDSPAMKAMKTAVIEKGIDINKYADRFGSNFNNDKRQFGKKTISMQMLERLCKGLDIKATLTLEDKDAGVPNPIKRKITVDLTEQQGGDVDD